MFEDSLMESSGQIHTRAGWFSGMAALLNGSVVLLLLLWPLMHPASLPRQALRMLLTAPAPPVPLASRVASAPAHAVASANPFTPPRIIPASIPKAAEQPAPAFDGSLTALSSDKGTGVMNGVPDSLGTVVAPVVHVAAPPKRVAISSGVMAGNRLTGADPLYPAIARAARVQGTVVLAATIAKSGAIENLRVVSGPPLLTGAALDAVRGWHYRPYLLNGEPVEVETTVRVVFTLGG